ncbi:hypothetical protein HWV62_40776 [Athelia sp. TMB]|nr:hypothetical protein HWV62_40776 [Athelia sp. TMB]
MSVLAAVEIWRDSFDSTVSPANGGGSARTNIDQPRNAPSPTSSAATPRARRLLPLTAMPSSAKKMLRRGARVANIAAFPGSSPTAALESPRTSLALPNTLLTPTSFQVPQSPLASSSMPAEANTPALRPPDLGITPTFWSPAHPPMRRPRSTWGRAPLAEGRGHGALGAGGTDEGAGKMKREKEAWRGKSDLSGRAVASGRDWA